MISQGVLCVLAGNVNLTVSGHALLQHQKVNFCSNTYLNTMFAANVQAIIYAPNDYPTIQQAINAASPGETIVVRDEIYKENIVVDKQLIIKSENGPDNCIIDGSKRGDVITIKADRVVIERFSIRNSSWWNAGIYVKSSHNIIKNNNISNNDCGIHLDESNNNEITSNRVENNWDGIYLWDSSEDVFLLQKQINTK